MTLTASKIPQPDSQLIERCKQGDSNAFGAIIKSTQIFAFRLAFKILLNEDDAKDAVQDSYIKIWRNIGNYQPKYLFTTWAHKIIVNTCLDRLKCLQRKKKITDQFVLPVDNTETNLINRDLADLIKQISRDLPEKQRIVFILKDMQDFSIEEISECMNISKGLVKSNLYYARKSIREKIMTIENRRDSNVVQ
ncbi:MAG: RNA polymerase sigma factor [Bacteroidales bacterium]|nr:RNA polymerase sigma factor [Bacteroidales bacterium]